MLQGKLYKCFLDCERLWKFAFPVTECLLIPLVTPEMIYAGWMSPRLWNKFLETYRFLKKNHLHVVWYWHCLCLKSAFDHRRGMLSPNTAENRSSFTKGRFITLGRATEYLRGSWNRISKEYELRRHVLQHMVRVLDVALWGLTTDWDKFQGRQNACGTYRQYVSLGIDYCPNLRANLGNQDRFIIRQLLGLVKVVAWGRRQIWGGLGKIGLTSEYSKTINDDNKTISSIMVWDTIPGISFCCCGLSSCQLGWLFSAEITNDDGVIKEETNDVNSSK